MKFNLLFFKGAKTALVLLVLVFFFNSSISGQLDWQHTAFGKWSARSKMAKKGFQFKGDEQMYFQFNAIGGKEQAGALANRLVVWAYFDLESLIKLKGSGINVSGAWYIGSNITPIVGALFPINTSYAAPQVRLFELYWHQKFAKNQFDLIAGRITIGPMEFGASVFLYDYPTTGISSSPGAWFANMPVTANSLAMATWGARLLFTPKGKDFDVRFGVYNGIPSGDVGRNGFDFSMDLDSSTFFMGEFAYKLNQKKDDSGLPGNYKFGYMYDTRQFKRMDIDGAFTYGNIGSYFIFDQMVFRERDQTDDNPKNSANWKSGRIKAKHSTDQGLYIWGNFNIYQDQTINIFPYWVMGGVVYKGAFAKRHADRVGIAYYYGQSSRYGPSPGTNGQGIEGFYNWQIKEWWALGFTFAYITNISLGTLPNAFIPGLHMQIEL
jgi:carbohydrate-selective porin OprB